MGRRETIIGINRILEKNAIPWRFDEQKDYPEGIARETTSGLFGDGIGKKVCTSGRSGINQFPSDVFGDLYDDFLGICGLHSGNKSLRDTFLAMADWAWEHVGKGSRQKLTAVILTDKWNATQYEEHSAPFKCLDVHLVVIQCVGEVPVQLPYVYTDRAIREFIEFHALNDEQIEAVNHVVRVIRSGHRVDSLADLYGIDNDVVQDLFRSAFSHECNEVLQDLNRVLM